MHEQQVLNYLFWLKDRGQVFAFPSLGPESVDTRGVHAEADARVPSSAVLKGKDEATSPPLVAIKVLFVSRDSLAAAEREMVERIGSALGLLPEHFQVVDESAAARFTPNFVITMGDTQTSYPKTLAIPHPRDMLQKPQLKVSAWENLQRVKSLLS